MQSIVKGVRCLSLTCRVPVNSSLLLTPPTISSTYTVQVASMSFYNRQDSTKLWGSMVGVSSQGKKRGRARNLLRQKNLNRGQMLGFGKKRVDFPGLTSKSYTGSGEQMRTKRITEISDSAYDKYEEGLSRVRDAVGQKRVKRRVNPLERGWSGGKPLGRRFGAPEAVNKEHGFDNFDSVLLEFKTVFHMTGNLGRVRRTSALMVTGNGNGTFGYSLTSGRYGGNFKTFRTAVNKAGLRLLTIDRYEDRTVFHDFFTQYGHTRILVQQRPPGTGIIAHRGIKAICELAGIKDIYAKVEGAVTMQSIVKAFVLGLIRQKTHQTLADEKRLHLVEIKPENDYYPRLLASPSDGTVRTREEIDHNEILDFEMISFEGHLPTPRKASKNPWEGTKGWDLHLRRGFAYRAHPRQRLQMRVENGEGVGAVRSYLSEKYPECREIEKKQKIKED